MKRKLLSCTLSAAMLAACVSGAQLSVSAAADVTVPDTAAVWSFAKFEGSAAVTAADKQTVSYDGFEIHLADGDSVTDGGDQLEPSVRNGLGQHRCCRK